MKSEELHVSGTGVHRGPLSVASSLLSPQSLAPSQTSILKIHRPLAHLNLSVSLHNRAPHPTSSELSTQSFRPSHLQLEKIHRWFSHLNWSERQEKPVTEAILWRCENIQKATAKRSEWAPNAMFDGLWGFERRDAWMLYICIFLVGRVSRHLTSSRAISRERIKSHFHCLNNIFWSSDAEMYNLPRVFHFHYCDLSSKKHFPTRERSFKYSCLSRVNKWRYNRALEAKWSTPTRNHRLISIACSVSHFFLFTFSEKMCCCTIACDKLSDFIDWSFWSANTSAKNETSSRGGRKIGLETKRNVKIDPFRWWGSHEVDHTFRFEMIFKETS